LTHVTKNKEHYTSLQAPLHIRTSKKKYIFSRRSQLNLEFFSTENLFKIHNLTRFSKQCGDLNGCLDCPDTIYNSLVFGRKRMGDKDCLEECVCS